MKKSELEKYRKQLIDLRVELQHVLKGTSANVLESDGHKGYSQHQADEGTDDFDRDMSIKVSGCEMEILGKVEAALARIDEGTYGICEVTGNKIPTKRLDALPYASMTVEAQEKREKGLI